MNLKDVDAIPWQECLDTNGYAEPLDKVIAVIQNMPTIKAEPVKHGYWEKVKEQPYFRKHFHNVACSECHREGIKKWNYCPNCGADMREAEKEPTMEEYMCGQDLGSVEDGSL